MRAIALATLLASLCLSAQAAPCNHPLQVNCQQLPDRSIVIGKEFVDPLAQGSAVLSQRFATAGGAVGQIDSVVFEGLVMYRLSVDASSSAPVSTFTLTRPPVAQPAYAWLENAAGDLAPDWVLLDTKEPADVSFAFANGLAPGQASRWLVDTLGAPAFAPTGLGSVLDLAGGGSVPQPLLSPVPEPAAAVLLMGGLAALRSRWRRA